jgi:hypothetical protein
MLSSKDDIPCLNHTCDRQNSKCHGCFGRSETLSAFVLLCDVVVSDTPQYDRDGALFDRFRSFRFSKLFFRDINATSSKVASFTSEEFHYNNNLVRRAVANLVGIVNSNGGWTVAGWHRRGQIADGEDYILSAQTKGHLVLLAPSNPLACDLPAFTNALISFDDANPDEL